MSEVIKVLIGVFVVLAVLMVSNVTAQTQDKSSFHFYIGSGLGVPTGNAEDTWRTGLHWTGRVGYCISNDFEVLVGFERHRFPNNEPGTEGGDLLLSLVCLDLKVIPTKTKVGPFAFAGSGLAWVKTSDLILHNAFVRNNSKTHMFGEIGAGYDSVNLFAYVKATAIFQDAGGAISFVSFSFGWRF